VLVTRVANNYWVAEQIRSQRVARRQDLTSSSVWNIALAVVGTRSDVRRRGGVIPSWVVFGMIILATLAVCIAAAARTHTKLGEASAQYNRIQNDVESLRLTNQTVRDEIERLRTDPRALELAARSRLNMVRTNEIVLPVE
jgi:cell division protein FtsB